MGDKILLTERQAVELCWRVQSSREVVGRPLTYDEIRSLVARLVREQGAPEQGCGE